MNALFTNEKYGSCVGQSLSLSLWYIYIYIPMYLPMSLFHKRTAGPISTKFCTDLPTNPGMVLSTSMTAPTRPPDPRVLQTPKDVSSSNFSRAAPGPGWLVYIRETVCINVPFSRPNRRTNLHQILHRPSHQLRENS